MKASEFINEAAIGTNPKRPAREGSRPARGHNPEARYKELDDKFNTPEQLKKDADYREYRKGVKASRKEQPAQLDKIQLDELSPETLKSYIKKSKGHSQKYDRLGDKADEKGDEELANKMWNKGDNRYAGDAQARVKLADLKDKKKGVAEAVAQMEAELAEHGKASRELCKSSKPDADLGASMLASCKSQGLRARDGDKSHKLGKTSKSRVKVGGHRIKGQKYGGPLPDWS